MAGDKKEQATESTIPLDLRTVAVPEAFRPLFEQADKQVAAYFRNRREDPAQATIEISGERYILVRAASMSIGFHDMIQQLLGGQDGAEVAYQASSILYDLAKTVGRADAREFHRRLGLTDPVQKLSTGPVHFAYSGWAFVDIHPSSHPSPDDDYFLRYDHPYSFEADSWLRAGRRADQPVCVMNAGYSAGWCEESFGLKLSAVEVTCRARGDDSCTFIMAPPGRLEEYLQQWDQLTGERLQAGPALAGFFQRKRLEERLREREATLRAMTDAAQDAVIMIDPGGLVTFWNRKAEEIFGYRAEEVMGQDLHELIVPEHLMDAHRRAFPEFVASGRGAAVGKTVELDARRRDGTVFPVEISLSAVLLSGGWHALGLVRDISQRKGLEVQLRQAQRLESIGRLAAGVAHELNTPAQFVGDSLEFLKESVGDLMSCLPRVKALVEAVKNGQETAALVAAVEEHWEEMDLDYLFAEIPKALERASDGIGRMAGIVRAMKEFGHPGTKERKAVDINRSLQNTLTVARNEYKYVAEVEEDYGELPPVDGFEAELNQVWLNLVVNAAHAIAERRGADGDDKGHIRVVTRREGDEVVVRISDDGCGIPAEIRDRVFDPFFTTKEVGKGTGQGLALARSVIVDKHGGRIELESEPGQGTTFSIHLPLRAAPAGKDAVDG